MTSVEYLESKLQLYENWIRGKHDAEQYTIFELFKDIETSKEMHKKEVKDGYNQGYRDGHEDGQFTIFPAFQDVSEFSNAENYYNETFDK